MEEWQQLLLLALLAAALVALHFAGKRKGENTRAARMMKKYATITSEAFDAIPEDELVEAVVCRVLAKSEEQRRPDPVITLSQLPHGSTVAYSVWAVCKEMAHGSFSSLMHTATREVLEAAEEALPVIGAAETAGALTVLHQAHKDKAVTDEMEQAFHRAVEKECPLALCTAYVRDHIPQLTGTDTEETADEA